MLWALPLPWLSLDEALPRRFVESRSGLELESCSVLPSQPGSAGAFWPGVGVIGLPPFISSTISSASRDRSPSGLNGLSQPLSVLKQNRVRSVAESQSGRKVRALLDPRGRQGKLAGARGLCVGGRASFRQHREQQRAARFGEKRLKIVQLASKPFHCPRLNALVYVCYGGVAQK